MKLTFKSDIGATELAVCLLRAQLRLACPSLAVMAYDTREREDKR